MVILIHVIKHTAFNRENMKLQIKKIILLLLIGTTLINCSVEEDFVKMNDKNASPIVKTILYEQADETFNRLKSDLKIERYLKSNLKSDIQARTTMDTLGLTIVTDLIKQVTLGDYTSYTMEIVNQKDTIIFYNLTLEYKNGESSMFVTKYIPDEYWLNNKEEYYSGGIFSKRVNKLKVHTELDDLFADNSGGVINGNDLGLGGGAGGGSFNFQGTPTYPADCNGIVIVSIQAIPYPCGCENHMPWECNGCSESPAGYNYIPYYFCQDYGNGGGGNPPDSGGASGGGPSNPLNPNDNSIGAMIMPVECTKKIVGDLNGDCMLSPYEMCMLNDYSTEVCVCFEQGGNLDYCLDKVIIDETFRSNPCLFDVYTQLGKVLAFQSYLQNFDGDFSVAHLKLSSSTSLPNDINAETTEPINYLINITINENNLNRPSLDIARTLIHEIIHAEIFRKLLSVAGQPNIPWSNEFIISIKDNYPGLYDYYLRFQYNIPVGQEATSAQHEAMAQHYRGIIKNALQQFDNSSNSQETYDALSWVGLGGTTAWNNLSSNEKMNIISLRNSFYLNNSNCQ